MNKQSRKQKIIRVIRLVAINLLVLFVLFELTSVVVYFVRTGEFFYTRSNARVDAMRAQFEMGQPTPAANSLLFQLHPYFGYVSAPSSSVNSSGFSSQHQFPFKKTSKDQFVIGIFGGSVAYNFTLYELETHALETALKRTPYLQNKEIVFLCFAAAGYKQPQQLLVLSYFLSIGEELDMVINIDGFNEVAFSYQNSKSGMEASMPTDILVGPLVDLANKDFSSETLTATVDVLRTRDQIRDALTSLSKCILASCYTLRWIPARLLINRYRNSVNALSNAKSTKSNSQENNSLVHVDKSAGPLDDGQAAEQSAEVWAHSSSMMNNLLTARNILYFHFIQPNQYFPTRRRFSKDERTIAIDENIPFRVGVEKGYPAILARVGKLRASGVKVFDGTNVLDQVEGIVYRDQCCHYNRLGEDTFGKFVAETIVAAHPGQSTQAK